MEGSSARTASSLCATSWVISSCTILSTNHAHESTKLEDRGKVLAYDDFRYRIGYADVQTKRSLARFLPYRSQKFAAQGKDFFGILQNSLPGIGQD